MTVLIDTFQKKRLVKALVRLSKDACDVEDIESALQILIMTEKFVFNINIKQEDKKAVIIMLVAGYESYWHHCNQNNLGNIQV
jgi:hypothetical protein